jgi:shikimate dehydrogenase
MTTQKTFVLLGHPVSHSVSPAIHQAVYRQFGLPHRYLPIDCPDEAAVLQQKLALVRGEIAGANITVPWKRVALKLADSLDASAAETGAVNVWKLDEQGRVVGYNTDAAALCELVEQGVKATGSANGEPFVATVLGSGGAALAAVVACKKAGATRIYCSARKWQGPIEHWPSREQFVALGASPLPWGERSGEALPGAEQVEDVLFATAGSRVIVQATSAGMLGVGNGDAVCRAVAWQQLSSNTFLYDVVYNPEQTPFLQRAKQAGLASEGGLSMLVGQAALAVQLWLGVEGDRDAMRAVAASAIFGAGS